MAKTLFLIHSTGRYRLYDGPNFSTGPLDKAPEADDETAVVNVQLDDEIEMILKDLKGGDLITAIEAQAEHERVMAKAVEVEKEAQASPVTQADLEDDAD